MTWMNGDRQTPKGGWMKVRQKLDGRPINGKIVVR
jgi:hypothetical protein